MRRRHLTTFYMAALVAAIFVVGSASAQVPPPQVQLRANKIPQFVDPLPLLDVAGGSIKTVLPSALGGTDDITLNMLTFRAKTMPSTFVPANGLPYAGTWTFGYRVGPTAAPATAVDTNVGPVIVAKRGTPTQINYVNNLVANCPAPPPADPNDCIHWRDWTDQSLHSAYHQIYGINMPTPFNAVHYPGPVPAVPHLHGGEDPAAIDGGPEAYFLSDQGNFTNPKVVNRQGPAYYSKAGAATNAAIYRYPNSQEAAPIWFHDHLLGGTRINATFAGLAGAYPIIDANLALPTGLHPVGLQNADGSNLRYTIPLVIQDRMFDTNGQLFFPNLGINPEHPYWIPEFVGDTIVVNGKVWPFVNVDQQRYHFYLINGSNSRPYEMFLQDVATGVKGPRMWVIATDGGYLDAPVLIDPNATGAQTKLGAPKTLTMMPGERYEIIIDFNDPVWKALLPKQATFPRNLVLRNIAPTVIGNPTANLDGRLVQFRVSANVPADTSYNPATPGTAIRSGAQAIKRLVNPATGTLAAGVTADKTRELTLVEIVGLGGPLEVLVNNTKLNGRREDATFTPVPGTTLINGNYIAELPLEGDTEVWEIVNTTADAHPIHLHGVQFQILNRQAFDLKAFSAAYAAAFPGGLFIPAYGPPLPYAPTTPGGKYGGNPDVTPFLLGLAAPPLTYEAGWKDTAIMQSGFVTRIAVRFAPQDVAPGTKGSFSFRPDAPVANNQPGAYVWHCHITDHEDNEMMRPYAFQPNVPDTARTYIQGVDY